MNLVFMGTPEFSVPSLERLIERGFHVSTVVTAPDKPKGRGRKILPTPVETVARTHGLAVLKPDRLGSPEFVDRLTALKPDMIVVVAFRVLPPQAYRLSRLGSFNLHASLLPKYRGAAPIQWAIINGEKVTGVSTFLLEEKVDTGALLLQESVTIGQEETAGELSLRLADIGADVVCRTARMLESGKYRTIAQDDSQSTPAPKINKEDCRIDWTRKTVDIHNRIRAFSPLPGAWTILRGKMLKIFRSGVQDAIASNPPGTTIRLTSGEWIVATGDGALRIEEVMLEGRKRMAVGEFLRGFTAEKGMTLGT